MEEVELLKSLKGGHIACSIFGCKNNKTNRPDLSFHRLPSVRDLQPNNEEVHSLSIDRRKAWLIKDKSHKLK